MSAMARVAWAFLRRDLLAVRPWTPIVESLDMGCSVVFWYFAARLVGASRLLPPGSSTDYFTFSLIGLALTQYVWRGFAVFANQVQGEQASGSLELLWVTPYPMAALVVLSSLWVFFMATVNAGIALVIGTYGFGAHLRGDDILRILGIGLVAALTMGALGLLVSSWTIASGRGEGFRPLIHRVIPLLSGAFFPITLFPPWLQTLAWCLPMTHALQLARGPLDRVTSPALGDSWAILLMLAVLLTIAGWGALTLAIRQARVNGRLAAG